MSAGAVAAAQKHAHVKRVLLITLAANLIVVVIKLLAGLHSRSLAVVADAAHSSVDALNNIMALALSAVAAQGPDDEHPYGHTKFETLGALAIVALLSVTVYELAGTAIMRLLARQTGPEVSAPVVAAMIVSALIAFLVSTYERKVGRALDSDLLVADSAHTAADVYASLAVLCGLGLTAAGFAWADPLFTLLVAAVIARAGWLILKSTVPLLVDERAVTEDTICRIALQTAGVLGCMDVRSRGREGAMFAELTITVLGTLDVESGHRIADEVERRIAAALGAREVVVHVEPHGADA